LGIQCLRLLWTFVRIFHGSFPVQFAKGSTGYLVDTLIAWPVRQLWWQSNIRYDWGVLRLQNSRRLANPGRVHPPGHTGRQSAMPVAHFSSRCK
jgi:hypothetical protein